MLLSFKKKTPFIPESLLPVGTIMIAIYEVNGGKTTINRVSN